MAAEEVAGFGVDGDEFVVAPDAGVVLVELAGALDGVTALLQHVGDRGGEALLDFELVGQVLMVEAGVLVWVAIWVVRHTEREVNLLYNVLYL